MGYTNDYNNAVNGGLPPPGGMTIGHIMGEGDRANAQRLKDSEVRYGKSDDWDSRSFREPEAQQLNRHYQQTYPDGSIEYEGDWLNDQPVK